MIKKEFFIIRKNYYLSLILHISLKFIYKIIWRLKIFRTEDYGSRKIIFVGPQHLGDILFTTPAIRYLKEQIPEISILFMIPKSGKIALKGNNNIEDTIDFEIPWFNEKEGIIINFKAFVELVKIFKKNKPNTVINYSVDSYHRVHIAMWLAKIPNRIGYAHKGLDFLLTNCTPYHPEDMLIQQILSIIGNWLNKKTYGYSLKPDYFVSSDILLKTKKKMDSIGISFSNKIVGISPGARHNFKWPARNYTQLCNLINANFNVDILFLGIKHDIEIFKSVQSKVKFHIYSLIDNADFEELAGILNHINLLITVDSGPRHLANAIGLRNIVLRHGANLHAGLSTYIDTEILLINDVPCSPCGKTICPIGTLDCMEGITAHRVYTEVYNILNKELV